MEFIVTEIDFNESLPNRVEITAYLSNGRKPVEHHPSKPTRAEIEQLFSDYLKNGVRIEQAVLRADYEKNMIPKTMKYAHGGCIPCSKKMEDGGQLGEIDGMLPSANDMSVIQPMAEGGSADNIGASADVQIKEMLLENTGKHFLDSGGDDNRMWQRNQGKIFEDEPRVRAEFWNGEFEYEVVSTYHYLSEILETDEFSYEINKYLRGTKDEEGYPCHWIGECREVLENSDEFAEQIEWLGNSENTYNYENNLSQVLQFQVFKNAYTGDAYCLLQIHGGADVRGGYTDTRCFKLEGYLTGQVDVYGSVDGVNVENTYNGYSLTTEDGEDFPFKEDSDYSLEFYIMDDVYADGGRIAKEKMPRGGQTFKTPESFVENLMDFSPYGALSQMFVIDAIGKYIDYTNSYTEEDIANDRGVIDAQTWVNTGKDIDAQMKSYYAHDGSYPNKNVKDNITLVKDIMKDDFFKRLYILEAINRQSKGVAEASDEIVAKLQEKNNFINMWGWRDTARDIQARLKEYQESKKEDGGIIGLDEGYNPDDRGKFRYILYDVDEQGSKSPLMDFYSDAEGLDKDYDKAPIDIMPTQELWLDDDYFPRENVTRSYFEDEPYYFAKGGKSKKDPQIVRYYFEDEPYEYGIGGTIAGALIGGYVGYRIGRSRPQKKGFGTEKAVVNKMASAVKDVTSKKKPAKAYAGGGSAEDSLYEKSTQKRYLEKYAKNGNLIRTAEQFDSGNWVVSEYPPSKTNLQGEYTNEEFKEIRKYFYAKGGSTYSDGGQVWYWYEFDYYDKDDKSKGSQTLTFRDDTEAEVHAEWFIRQPDNWDIESYEFVKTDETSDKNLTGSHPDWYEDGGETDGKETVRGTAYYITGESVENTDEYTFDELADNYLESRSEFEELLYDDVILEYSFKVDVKYDWQVVQAVYEEMAEDGIYGSHIIGYSFSWGVSEKFKPSAPYSNDDEYAEGGKTQGYDDRQDESLGMRTGKESSKKQNYKARRDDSYGKWGKRDSEHRDISMATGGAVKIANKDARSYVANREPFNGNNLSAKLMPNGAYVVLSYGYYPLFVYKYKKWYENKEKYSVSTSKQTGQARPTSNTVKKTTNQLKKLAGL